MRLITKTVDICAYYRLEVDGKSVCKFGFFFDWLGIQEDLVFSWLRNTFHAKKIVFIVFAVALYGGKYSMHCF